jgi:hypothetical protein
VLRRRNLVLVTNHRVNRRSDFERIAAHVREGAPDVAPFVLKDARARTLLPLLALRPTLVVSPIRLKRFRPWRGCVRQGRALGKPAEYRALERRGLPVPRWTTLATGQTPDLDGFGDYVVVKPEQGGRGAEVKIKRKGRVRWRPIETRYPVPSQRWIVQDFIYTGPWPVSYRVTTLFGETLFAWRSEADHGRRPLRGPTAFRGGADGGGMSIVSSGRGCRISLADDPEILRLAQRAHAAFPELPVLGVDILREEPTGKLYVLEVNSIGRTWHLSSPTGREIQASFGLDFEAQFDGLRKAARVLVEQTRRQAR